MDSRVQAKYEQVEGLRSLLAKVTSTIKPDSVQSTKSHDKLTDTISDIIERERAMNEEIDELLKVKKQAKALIDAVEDDTLHHLLELRYLNFKSWEECAVEMHFTYRHIHRLHSQALRLLEGKI